MLRQGVVHIFMLEEDGSVVHSLGERETGALRGFPCCRSGSCP